MLFMAKDNMYRVYFICILYLLFLFFDNMEWNHGDRKGHINGHIKNLSYLENDIDAIILGGSNSAFSISAEILSDKTDQNWYNLSLPNEGYSDNNYRDFIKKNISRKDKDRIHTIVFSTLKFSRKNHLINRESYKGNLYGYTHSILKPNQSILSYIQKFMLRGSFWGGFSYSEPSIYGDFEFSTLKCIPDLNQYFFMENIEKASDALLEDIIFFKKTFQNARVIIEFPTELYEASNFIFIKEYFKKIGERTLYKLEDVYLDNNTDIFFVETSTYVDESYVCDATHHANINGREWRTLKLLEKIISL